jgi:hypothetical protein
MRIRHPLWLGSTLELRSRVNSDLQMMTPVRRYIVGKERCDDLTADEVTLVAQLRRWLAEQNADYE